MFEVTEFHFLKAAREIGRAGDNDTLPYDADARYIKERFKELAAVCVSVFDQVKSQVSDDQARQVLNGLAVFSERLLAPSGPHGFRIVQRVHPFWNLYLNGLAVAILSWIETRRSDRVTSYRSSDQDDRIFDTNFSWRAYKSRTVEALSGVESKVVVQTDIPSFYERIYHHRLENILLEVIGREGRVPLQIDRMLAKMSGGRSFGLPVGGHCARVLAEAVMMPIDEALTHARLNWYRYVDDFTVICDTHQEAYSALSTLSHTLADYGLSLNKTKTTIMNSRYYADYVKAQLGEGDKVVTPLHELDLHFDPYSDNALTEYSNLQDAVSEIDFEFLLNLEKEKSQPDSFIIAQISRALQFQNTSTAANLCSTLLDSKNLDSFRASWSKIMRGVYAVRSNLEFAPVFDHIDGLLDRLAGDVPHLLLPEVNTLHFLKILRFVKTDRRAQYIRNLFETSTSITVKRACIECWQHWGDQSSFMRVRNQWYALPPEVQRMLWLAAGRFGDDGLHARKQLKSNARQAWALGVEAEGVPAFADIFIDWAKNA